MMTLDQVGELLKVLAAYDGRNVGQADVLVWARQIAEFDGADAVEAVHRHYAETTEWAKPAHIRAQAVRIRNARTRRPEVVAPGCYEPDPAVRRRLGTDSESRLALASSADVTHTIRVGAGLGSVHDVLNAIAAKLAASREPVGELSPSEQRRQLALQRAAAERRGRPMDRSEA